MRGLFSLAAILGTVAAQYLEPAPTSAVKPILNGTAEFENLFNYAPKEPPVVPYPGNANTTEKNPPIPTPDTNITVGDAANQFFIQAACTLTPNNPTKFWRETVNLNGASPFNSDPTYQVYRNVRIYGAKGDGVTDDSGAFQFAIDAWSRSSNFQQTAAPALIYVPSGTYKISNSIRMLVGTMMIGDPLNKPVLKADANLGSNPIINGFDSSRFLVSTTNFFIGIKNIKLDTTAIGVNTPALALNWPVSQATQLYNVDFSMPNFSQHVGITMDGGSTGGGSGTILSDLSFTGGAIGIRLNNQQYMFKSLKFNGCNTAIAISHVFFLTVQDASFTNCGTGIDMGGNGVAGSVSLIDSSASSVGVVVNAFKTGNGAGSLVVENFVSTNSGATVAQSNGGQTLVSGSVSNTWVMGNANPGDYQGGTYYTTSRSPSLLAPNGKYFLMPQPQYQQYGNDQFVNVKDQGAKGDGVTDDTATINAILLANAGCKIVYFPQGTYLVHDTIYIPPGTRIVGDVWSTISAVGSKFWDANNPHVVVRVGNAGEVGVAQITDMIITTADVLNGAILMEVNMAGNSPGDVGFWNTHFRIGGTVDTKVNTNCAGPDASACKATFLMLHITTTGSPYIENMWGWTADHSLDGGPPQVISTGRGALIRSTKATWMIGTAFEHNTLYQYNIVDAQNLLISFQQTETAYWQGPGAPISAPTPWAVNSAYSDPNFSGCGGGDAQCRMGWAQRISGGSNIYIYGSGFWVFFNGLTFADGHGYGGSGGCEASCCQSSVCQASAAEIVSGTKSLYWYNVNTHLFTNLIVDGGNIVKQFNNPGSWGGVVAAFLAHVGA
ncbi:pectate lyase superfamily protein-domain-containing protein [Tuber indicum]|nr:pectate lyase superfamily protein-domain-containing protein [Tuber indicum]